MAGAKTVATRDRLIDEAMRLFGERGYRATSVAQIEAAAGLTPGSGGLYHHFRSKEQLLDAGVDRLVDRLRALADIREIFEGLTDLRSELMVLGRYTLTVLDEESKLMRIVSAAPRGEPGKLADAVAALIDQVYAGMADWIGKRVPGTERERVESLAVVALNVLVAQRTTEQFLGVRPLAVDDERVVAEWVEMMAGRIERLAVGQDPAR